MKKRRAARSHTYLKTIEDIRVESNKDLKKAANRAIDQVERQTTHDIRAKIFLLDHTAEVLENFRRLQEYKIWKFELHSEREKLVALKKESIKYDNLIENYEALYGNRAYLEDTSNEQEHYKHQLKDFIENRKILHQEFDKLAVTNPQKVLSYKSKMDDYEVELEDKQNNLFPNIVDDRDKYESKIFY